MTSLFDINWFYSLMPLGPLLRNLEVLVSWLSMLKKNFVFQGAVKSGPNQAWKKNLMLLNGLLRPFHEDQWTLDVSWMTATRNWTIGDSRSRRGWSINLGNLLMIRSWKQFLVSGILLLIDWSTWVEDQLSYHCSIRAKIYQGGLWELVPVWGLVLVLLFFFC